MTTARPDPYKGFNFLVEIDGIAVAGFSECSGLTTHTDVIEYREGADKRNSVRKLPGLTHYDPIVLKRGLTQDKSLWKWRQSIVNGVIDRRNISIVLLDDARQPLVSFRIADSWPSRWEGPSLNARASEVAIETLEIVHEGIDLE
jgi:phage tail-like protein